ncbi:hypothetical protein [Nocardia donostiensis]|uniref:Uncharacterized protein n=1 Tax=Nocardia donostiensis TaxID=1538463 RepID=A0A1W0BIC7_9NOCA|nr:hypothetical protein [Nocardia donostiensis]ONM49830.1 hypothetical protein B0T46_05380 [Nocardia donostiensis]OQS12693.1 hypothetical protein B0T36_23710 [Nocardia donostiensis]OQS22218.1 hypothetical protein B0T44_06155 [Nocardia donostiensis]
MHDWPAPDSGELPTPELIAAWVALDIVPCERIPLWAAHWLVQGYDGEALRKLAGSSGADPHEVRDILPAALADCTAAIPDSDAAAAQVAFTKLARMHVDNRATERWVLDKVCEIVARSGYADSVVALPLGQIFDIEDEWGAGWGRTEQQLAHEIQNACRAQLATDHEPFQVGGRLL